MKKTLYLYFSKQTLLSRRNRRGERPLMYEIPAIEAWILMKNLILQWQICFPQLYDNLTTALFNCVETIMTNRIGDCAYFGLKWIDFNYP